MGSMSRWLDVEVGGDTELHTLGSNLALVDLHNDKEYKLVVGDFGGGEEPPKLKVFKGATQLAEVVLPDLPLGVVALNPSQTSPRSVPVIAVAFATCIYLYRNLKLYYKYYAPVLELSSFEKDAWTQLSDPANHIPEAVTSLAESLRNIPYKILTSQTKQFLSLTLDEQLEYLEQMPEMPNKKAAEITCVASVKLNSVDKYAVSCLVVGSEDGDVAILDPQTFTLMHQAKICEGKKTPYQIVATGLFSVDYRLIIATREKAVCLLKREWTEGRVLFTTDEHIIAVEVMPSDCSALVICTDNTMSCYSKKGTRQWHVTLQHRPSALTLLPVHHLGATLAAVSLASGHVHVYDGKALVDTLFVRDVASVMKFGQLGQEEHVLSIVTANGNLMLKILKRTADFHVHATGVESGSSPAPAQLSARPWVIPKKSKLFLEQSMRERENAVAMHETFQLEMNRLRLCAAQSLIAAYATSDNSIGAGALEPVRLSAEVQGLGPIFRVTLAVENTSTEKAVVGLSILFYLHNTNYTVANPYIKVPLIAPVSTLRFPTKIEEIFDGVPNPDVFFRTVTGQGGDRSLVKVLLLKEGRSAPVLAAILQMPPTDPLMMPFDKMQDTSA